MMAVLVMKVQLFAWTTTQLSHHFDAVGFWMGWNQWRVVVVSLSY